MNRKVSGIAVVTAFPKWEISVAYDAAASKIFHCTCLYLTFLVHVTINFNKTLVSNVYKCSNNGIVWSMTQHTKHKYQLLC